MSEAPVTEAELHAYPMHPDWSGYFDPLDKLPPAAQEMYVYDPKKAKKLLAEAGYPNGFSFKMQYCSCSPDDTELAPYLVAYLEQVGVKVELQPMEYAALLSVSTATCFRSRFSLANFAITRPWNGSMKQTRKM